MIGPSPSRWRSCQCYKAVKTSISKHHPNSRGNREREREREKRDRERNIGNVKFASIACVPRGAGNQNGTTGDFAILDHLQDDSGGLPRLFLTHETLRARSGLERGAVDAETSNVRMRGDEIESPKLLRFGDGHHRLARGVV